MPCSETERVKVISAVPVHRPFEKKVFVCGLSASGTARPSGAVRRHPSDKKVAN
jgi:hypothetical protein